MHNEAANQSSQDAGGDPRAEPSSPAPTDHPLTPGDTIEAVNRAEAAAQDLAEDIDILDVDTLLSQVNAVETPPAASPASSTSPVVDPPPAAPAYTPTIAELDAALAGNVEELIEGDFTTVDAILDRVFEDHAAIVADETGRVLSGMPQGSPPSPSASTSQRDPRVVHESEPQWHHIGGFDQPYDRLTFERNIADPAVIEAALAAAPLSAESSPSDAPFQPLTQPHAIPIGVAIPAPSEFNHSITPSSGRLGTASLIYAIVECIGSVMIAALAALNYPLRLMPASLRPVVNVLAATLILWVPIVWSVAVLGLNKTRHTHVAADPAAQVDSNTSHSNPASAH